MIHNLTLNKPYEHLLQVWQEVLAEADANLFIREAIPEDGILLNIREEQKDTYDNPSLDYLIRIHAFLKMLTPMNYSIFHKNDLLLMANILPVAEGVGEISFLTDTNFVTAPREIKLPLLQAFHTVLRELPFRRLQAKVKHDFNIGKIFVERMGFVAEGVLKNYGPLGDDYIMYSLIK